MFVDLVNVGVEVEVVWACGAVRFVDETKRHTDREKRAAASVIFDEGI